MPLFTAGQVVTAAQLNALAGFVRKTADESVTSSAVLQNDDHLSFAVGIGTYVIDLWLYGTSAANASGDLSIGFTFPTATCSGTGIGPDVGLASGNIQTGQWGATSSYTSGTLFNAFGLSTSPTITYVHLLLITTASGTFQLQWAQAASNAAASTLKAGSHMCVRQVA